MKRELSDRSARIVIAAALLVLVLSAAVARLAGVEFTYTVRTVAMGGALLGALSGAVGSFAVLRKQSLMGDALSHAALPGVGIGFLVAGRSLGALLAGAAVASLIGVWFIGLVTRHTRIKQDSAMGIVLAGWFAVGIGILAFIQQRPDASQAGLDTFIFGQAAAIVESDVRLLLAMGLVVTAILLLGWKELKLVTFDPAFASANGYPVRLVTAVLLALIVVVVVLGLQLAGVVLMVGLLIAPGIAARQWTNRLEQMVLLAAIIGATAGGLGSILSAVDADLPTGPLIIVVVSIFVALSLLFSPGRGVVWRALRRRTDRRRFAAANVLKTAYRYATGHGSIRTPVGEEFLLGVVGPEARRGVRELRESGDLSSTEAGYVLTNQGSRRAEADERLREGGADVRD